MNNLFLGLGIALAVNAPEKLTLNQELAKTFKNLFQIIETQKQEILTLQKHIYNNMGICYFTVSDVIKFDKDTQVTGLYLSAERSITNMLPILYIKMPCGEVYTIKWGDTTPTNNVPCSCGNTNHWFLRFNVL